MATIRRPTAATEPIYTTTRVFPTDDGMFRYEIKLWVGDVDVRNEPPSSVVTSRPYKTRKGAGQAATRALAPILST